MRYCMGGVTFVVRALRQLLKHHLGNFQADDNGPLGRGAVWQHFEYFVFRLHQFGLSRASPRAYRFRSFGPIGYKLYQSPLPVNTQRPYVALKRMCRLEGGFSFPEARRVSAVDQSAANYQVVAQD